MLTYDVNDNAKRVKVNGLIRVESKHFGLDDVSSFIAQELDKVEQRPDVYSTWYLSVRFRVGFVTHSRFWESIDMFRRFGDNRVADNLERREEQILKGAGFTWSYSFGLGGGSKHSLQLHENFGIGDVSSVVIIPTRMKEIGWEELIDRSKILQDLDLHIKGEWKERELIKKDLPGLLEKTYENGRCSMAFGYKDENEETKTYALPINKKSPEIIIQKNREYQKQVEVKKKLLSDPIAMIHYYQATHN